MNMAITDDVDVGQICVICLSTVPFYFNFFSELSISNIYVGDLLVPVLKIGFSNSGLVVCRDKIFDFLFSLMI